MLKRGIHKTCFSKENIPLVRRYFCYILLLGFINTIVVPTHSIVHYYVKSASLQCSSPLNANLLEYIVEDYLDITPAAMAGQETDVHDMEISLEDVDFIHYSSIGFLYEPIQTEPTYCLLEDYLLFNSYLAHTTPPPEV